MKKVFFTPQYPTDPEKGMGYIEIDQETSERIGISPEYRPMGYGGWMCVKRVDGTEFTAYCDNPNGFGGRNKRRFKVHSHGEVIGLVTQKKLTINAVLYFVQSWADQDAKIITPGKRTINLDQQKTELPSYVYFVINQDSNAIKIGTAKNVRRRLASLQTSSPAKLELLCSIKAQSVEAARELEQSLHQKFVNFHIRGEWFRVEAELLNYISQYV